VANAYLEGTSSEVYPDVSPNEVGLKRDKLAVFNLRA
jgi:phosphoketolase